MNLISSYFLLNIFIFFDMSLKLIVTDFFVFIILFLCPNFCPISKADK